MGRDWNGNSKSVFTPLASSSHSDTEREVNDFYATDPIAIDKLLECENFTGVIWECAAGKQHLSRRIKHHGLKCLSSDLYSRNQRDVKVLDFLKCNKMYGSHIITNPPYKFATEFVYKALELLKTGNKCAMFLKLTFLETKSRRELFTKYPPKVVYVFSQRMKCAKGGDFEKDKSSSAVAYAWFVWEKGFTGNPIIKWI